MLNLNHTVSVALGNLKHEIESSVRMHLEQMKHHSEVYRLSNGWLDTGVYLGRGVIGRVLFV